MDPKERKVIKSNNDSVTGMVNMVLANIEDAEAPLGISMVMWASK